MPRLLKIVVFAACCALFFGGSATLFADQPTPTGTKPIPPDMTPAKILGIMEHVGDWQLANPSTHKPLEWTQGAFYTGMMALGGISGEPKYLDAMLNMAGTNHWEPGPRKFDADDYCVGQTYAELFLRNRDPHMIAPLRERFDDILAQPSDSPSMEYKKPYAKARERWIWCDALFMGPPTWVRLYSATGDTRYLDFAVTNWWQTSDFLYDPAEHLFFRDSNYITKKEANGKKVFWGRGNGWVMAGLVRVLQGLPNTHPDRARFLKQYREMAAKVAACQQEDGLWRSSLLDPASFPLKEASGSAFFTYALAWGLNQGLLEGDEYTSVVLKGWTALAGCVQPDGRLTHVQPVGADPKKFDENATESYGVGAFLLAGSEMYRMAVAMRSPFVQVKVTNPSALRRESETIEVDWGRIYGGLGGGRAYRPPNKAAVMDGVSSRILDSQLIAPEDGHGPEKLLFQADLAPKETRVYRVMLASGLAAAPPPLVKTYARLVTERFNDFAWESDRTAHRMYQQALIKGEGTISSGIDVWSKGTRGLVIDKWYKGGDYHEDHGEGMDDYRVGRSRGCGGLGIWDGKQLYNSINFKEGHVITTGPIRSEFEVTYDTWDAGGRKVSETKRIRIEAGSNFSRAQSVFESEDKSPLGIGVGVAQRPVEGTVAQDQAAGWVAYWQPADRDRGNIGCAVVLPGGIKEITTEKASFPAPTQADIDKPSNEGLPPVANLLAITQAEVGKPFVYYLGAGWSKSGDFPDAKAWENCVRNFAARLKEPVKVEMSVP